MMIAATIGFALSQQPVINAATAEVLKSPLAAAAFSLSLSTVLVFIVLLGSDVSTQPAHLWALPWWSVLAGVIGAVFVAGGAILVPLTGASLFFVCLIAGQLIGAVFADFVGNFGSEQRGLSLRKTAGVVLAIAGAALVRWG